MDLCGLKISFDFDNICLYAYIVQEYEFLWLKMREKRGKTNGIVGYNLLWSKAWSKLLWTAKADQWLMSHEIIKQPLIFHPRGWLSEMDYDYDH